MFTLNCKGRLLVIDHPIVMGIINATADSFYTGSRKPLIEQAVNEASRMIEEGATILDIGGQSTRPGSELIDKKEESARVMEIIRAIRNKHSEVFISIDTYYGNVAEDAINAGADIINDISAGSMDETLLSTVARLKVPYVLMHIKGSPQTMTQFQQYENVSLEVFDFLKNKIAALHKSGIDDIIIDPGFGFAKNTKQNFELLGSLQEFTQLGKPILAGISRKGMVYKTIDTDAEHALNGTSVLNTVALLKGASVLRVHDVKEAIEAIKLVQQLT